MKYLTAALLLAALVAGPSQAQDGPFGLNMGEDPAKYGCALSGDSDFFHFCENVPKPHPDVKSYGVWSYPETGIAFIIGMGDTHENDRYGSSVRAEIDRIARQIASKYGDWTDYSDWIAQCIAVDPGS